MSELEMTLPELDKKFEKYEKKMKFCIERLGKDFADDKKDRMLGNARYVFMLHINMNKYHSFQVTPDAAFNQAIFSITKDRDLSLKTISACCQSRILLRKFIIIPCSELKNKFLRATA